SISDKYGDFSFSDNSEIGNSDDSSYRWANPRSYKLEFTVDSGEISQTCRGTLSISEDSYPLDDLPDFDRLNPEDGESILKASKVTISSSCER
ncbi:hypothetical protein, partial [Gordonia alkaliphila]|uniref:hypothetical protein n=1 Tax=Gordonia alkaliphila TaxID=1053547 RepID=UPI0031EF3388